MEIDTTAAASQIGEGTSSLSYTDLMQLQWNGLDIEPSRQPLR
jgi:hypothetical protein